SLATNPVPAAQPVPTSFGVATFGYVVSGHAGAGTSTAPVRVSVPPFLVGKQARKVFVLQHVCAMPVLGSAQLAPVQVPFCWQLSFVVSLGHAPWLAVPVVIVTGIRDAASCMAVLVRQSRDTSSVPVWLRIDRS